MAAQIRPNRLDVTDRFPMLGFTIRTDAPPRVAEVAIATDPALFVEKEKRTFSNFYTSREHGLLSIPRGEAVYVVRPDVLARFIQADRLYFGLATATPPAAGDWRVELTPTAQSPYISLTGLSDRALRRVRMFPLRNGASYGVNGAKQALEWAGDRAQPSTTPAAPAPAEAAPPASMAPATSPAAAPAPADVAYDDGFGPLPPLQPAGESPAPAAGTVPAAQQGFGRSWSRAFEVDPETMGIEEPVLDEAAPPQALALGSRPRALTAAEYSGVTRIMPSPAYNEGRRGQTIDRIVIHITGAPQTPYIGSWFAREEANTSAHYMVDQNGEIIQFVREQDTAWHARGANRRSIGIEHVAIQQGGARYKRRDGSVQTFPYTPPTDAEYRASAALVAHLCRKHGLTPDRTTIIGHREADTNTTHTSCPDGAWDWDLYMTLVAECYAATPAAQALRYARGFEVDPETMGIDGPACSDESAAQPAPDPAVAAALALTAGEYDRVSRIAPSPAFTAGRSGTTIDRIVIHITDAPTTSSTVNHFTRSGANSSSHYLVGQDGEVIQFVSETDTAWHAKGANRRSIGIEHVAVKQGGATYGNTTFPYMPPTDTQYCESAALVSHLCQKYGLTPDRTTIIGHREADSGTTHTSCPDGAWNWDHFMQLVTTASCSPQPAAQALALPARARRRATTVAMDAATITVSPEQQRIAAPQVETVPQLRSIAIQAMLAANPALTPLVLVARAAAEAAGVSVGIGPAVSGGLLAGGGLGAGIIFAPGNVMGIYGQVEINAGFIASIGASVQLTVVSGGVDAFRGLSYTAGISGGEGLTGGAAALFDEQREFQGVTLQVGVGAGLSPVDIYTGVQRAIAGQLGLAMARGSSLRAAALGAGGDTVEIKYRVFIPSPLIKGPNSDYDLGPIASGEDFSGDNRGFSYDQGTSRAEITATLTLDADSGISNLTTVNRRWGESKAFDSSYTYHVDGKPDWWMDKHAGLDPSRRATLPVSDDNLSISRGASTTQRSILAVTSQSSVVSIKVAGALPLISPSPDIDADVCVYLKRGSDGGIEAMVVGDHDGFPCHELYINRQQVYTYDPVAAGNDPSSLFPPTDREISTGWIAIPSLASAGAQALGARPRPRARAFDAEDWSINWDDVFPVGQPTNVSCWATAAAMIDGWRRRQSVSIDAIARFDNLSTKNGLPPASAARFAEAIGFTVNPNACYTPEGFRDILEANGPVWVAAKVPGLHAIVVTGMYRKDGQYYVRITDPWDRVVGTPGAPGAYADTHATGSQYIMTYDAFAAEFEAAGDTDFAQLLHTGGTHGHAINRDSAAPAGYALALRARALDADDWTINWDDVFPVGQPTDMSCWATAAAMLIGWRDRMSVSPELLAKYNGLTSSLTGGLAPGDKAAFANAIGLTVHPNACYTPEGFRDILEANGPVWVTAKVPGVHAIVVTGMYRKDGQYYVRITDPWDRVVGTPGAPGAYADTHATGSQYILTYDAFTAEFEAAGDVDRIQLLHCNGPHGHAINRGSASGAGYALSLGDGPAAPAPAPAAALPVPSPINGGDARLGPGTSLTRKSFEKNGRRYDLAQLAGFVEPQNALAGGAGMPPLPGERVVLDDWPYIDGPSGRTQAGVAIDWQYRSGAVGEVAVAPIDGQVLDGWTASVRADIAPNGSTPDRASLKLRVTTTFSRPGEEDQVAVTDVTLSGDGRQSTIHGADRAPEPALPVNAPANGGGAAPAQMQPQLVTA